MAYWYVVTKDRLDLSSVPVSSLAVAGTLTKRIDRRDHHDVTYSSSVFFFLLWEPILMLIDKGPLILSILGHGKRPALFYPLACPGVRQFRAWLLARRALQSPWS